MKRFTAAIVGATGYTGAELLRLLQAHPEVAVVAVTSRRHVGQRMSSMYPHLFGLQDLPFSTPDDVLALAPDVVFFATPHGVCMDEAARFLERGCRIVDLSADFRLRDAAAFEAWYGMAHRAPDLLAEAVYGLPEYHREAIRAARLVGNPGCYPTAVQIGFKPLLQAGVIPHQGLIADVKSGVSGAGREAKVANLYAEVSENFRIYGAAQGHRHQVEIEQGLSQAAGAAVRCTFVPHLLPMIRGIEATLYAPCVLPLAEIHALYVEAYADETFVEVLPLGVHPETRFARGSNRVVLGIFKSVDDAQVIVSAVEDNLVKGAAGQAIQNMNLMLGLVEGAGLSAFPWAP
ncbi:MAG: N-acetyl-gamma-glutamyl-phosphate reductase [Cardiobacteriaceae bacterium]|nr:N-acetyl-gamma-glutamyl-phosphate reductase [Cardiobacteriaceae bacterium]